MRKGLEHWQQGGTENNRIEICLGNPTAGLLATKGEERKGKYLKWLSGVRHGLEVAFLAFRLLGNTVKVSCLSLLSFEVLKPVL